MPKFASTGLLAVTGGLAGLGAGLATAARDYGQYAANKDLQNDRQTFEMQKVALADKLAGVRAQEQRDWEGKQKGLDRNADITKINLHNEGTLANTGLAGQFDIRGKQIGEHGANTRKYNELDVDRQKQDKELGFKEKELAANVEANKDKLALGEKQLNQGYDIEMQKMAASRDIKEMDINAQSAIQKMILNHDSDKQIRQFAQDVKMENLDAKNTLKQVAAQATEQRENIRTEYGFRETMQKNEIYSTETMASAERTLKRELGQLQAGTELTKTGMVLAADKYIAQLKEGSGAKDGKINEKLVAALLVSMNDLQKKVNDGEATEGEISVLRQRERTFQAVTGVNIRDMQDLDLSGFDQGATDPGEPTQTSQAPSQQQPSGGRGFLDSLRGALPGQQGSFATGLLNQSR